MMKKYIALTSFVATMPLANWLIGNVGTTCITDGPCLIPVGFGLLAPSGVLLIGLALVLRDLVHDLLGWKWAVIAVVLGSILSFLTSTSALAVASALSFLAAELVDAMVYSRLRIMGKHIAVIASGIVGAALDSCLFVWIAFGSLEFSSGTTLAKIYASVLFSIFLYFRSARKKQVVR